MATKLGQKVMIPVFLLGMTLIIQKVCYILDREGVEKAVKLIDQGVAVGVVYDTQTAYKEGKQSRPCQWLWSLS